MNPKSELQELLQKLSLSLPEYEEESSAGPSHCPYFVSRVRVKWRDGKVLVEKGEGRKKKDAHQNAATKMLQRIRAEDGGGDVYDDKVSLVDGINMAHGGVLDSRRDKYGSWGSSRGHPATILISCVNIN